MFGLENQSSFLIDTMKMNIGQNIIRLQRIKYNFFVNLIGSILRKFDAKLMITVSTKLEIGS